MRKILLLMLASIFFGLTAFAEGLTATLSQNGTLSAYYGANAFKEAYEAASDSAVITLSGGKFSSPSKIEKSITIVGNGAWNESSTSPSTTIGDMTVAADSVTIEGIKTSTITLSEVKNFSLLKSQVTSEFKVAADSTTNTNTIVEDSYICNFSAIKTSVNCYINRCSIYKFTTINSTTNLAVIENTNVSYWLVSYGDYNSPYAIYRNCRLGCGMNSSGDHNINIYSPREFYDTQFVISPYSNVYNLTDYTFYYNAGVKYSGLDRVIVACLVAPISIGSFETSSSKYGPIGHLSYPAIPEITSAEIDNKTDGEGKLKVKLNVKVH